MLQTPYVESPFSGNLKEYHWGECKYLEGKRKGSPARVKVDAVSGAWSTTFKEATTIMRMWRCCLGEVTGRCNLCLFAPESILVE